MSLTATSHSIRGTLRQEIVIDNKHRLITDEPEAVGGDGSAPAPHELLPAALAGCVSTTLVMYARTKGWDLGDVTVDVEYDNHATPRTFEIAIGLTGELSGAQLDRLERVAAACPVRRSIEAGIEFHEQIWRRSGEQPSVPAEPDGDRADRAAMETGRGDAPDESGAVRMGGGLPSRRQRPSHVRRSEQSASA